MHRLNTLHKAGRSYSEVKWIQILIHFSNKTSAVFQLAISSQRLVLTLLVSAAFFAGTCAADAGLTPLDTPGTQQEEHDEKEQGY